MNAITYPFWIVTKHHEMLSLPIIPADAPAHAAAFTTAQLATEFMVGRGETAWELKLVTRPTLLPLIANFRGIGLKGICLDPAPGSLGTLIQFDQIK